MSFLHQRGFSLLEVLIGIALLAFLSIELYASYVKIVEVIEATRLKLAASALANEQIEIARNLSYSSVGILGGVPAGLLTHVQTLNRGGIDFTATTTVRNIDDPFDGTIGSTTKNDLAPADYKLIAVEIGCALCKSFFVPLTLTSTVAPRNLESASTNGALFIKVFDATGAPVSGAAVHIENSPAGIIIDDVTDAGGELQIVDTPPGAGVYAITVSKAGYSSEQTYPPGGFDNPNPVKPNPTVATQSLTQASFAIDKVSTVNVTSTTNTCSAVGAIDFTLTGTRLIGTSPDIVKYSSAKVTSAGGTLTISNLEWDTYRLTPTDSAYDLAGSIPALPLILNPNTTLDLKLIVVPKNQKSLLVTVKDASTGLPISDATVNISQGSFSDTLTTGRGFLRQTDWSGGAGQVDFTDTTKYFSSDGNIDTGNPAGDLTLVSVFGQYQTNGTLTSSTFDTGSPSNFASLTWQPGSEPPETGAQSIKFQLASNNDKTTWSYLGPDGTAGSYYTTPDSTISNNHNGNRYMRYKLLMNTASTTFTPTISDVAFTFTSDCVPSGQVFFSSLATNDYTLTITKAGYQPYSGIVTVASPWQETIITLSP